MKKVLLLTDVSFWEKCSGHRMRISALVAYLADHVQLTVVNTGPAPANIEEVLATQYEAEFFVLEKNKYLNSNGYGRRFKAFMKGREFDTIIIEYIHCSYFLNFLVNDVKVILDAHDIVSERADGFREFNYTRFLSGPVYEMSGENERDIFSVYDNVIAICQPDFDKINQMTGLNNALLCPHPVSIKPHPVKNEVKSIAFVASPYVPNRDAIVFFIENCWPRIAEKHNVELNIYGTICHELPFIKGERITLKGFVPDQNLIYEEADIIINPVRFGAGLKIKNVEALSNGLPLVTTSHGARGIEGGQNSAFLIADTAADFVTAIDSLIESPTLRRQLHTNALKFIEENFSPQKCFGPLLDEINRNVEESIG